MNDVVDLAGHLRDAVARAREQRLAVPPTEGDGHQTGDEGVRVGSDRLDAGVVSALTPNSPSPAEPGGAVLSAVPPGPYIQEEYDALVAAVWDFDGCESDLTRFDELLTTALAFIGRIARDGTRSTPLDQERAALLLRRMEQRALWGPDHTVVQP